MSVEDEHIQVKLTARQYQCHSLRQRGMTERQIGRTLGISAPAVHKHLGRAKQALGLIPSLLPVNRDLSQLSPREMFVIV